MTLEKRVRTALAGIGWDICNTVYRGNSDRYIVFQHSDTAEWHGDDAPIAARALCTVHLFAPVEFNVLATELAAKRALFAAGFTWADREDASDGDSTHIVLEFEDMVPVEPETPVTQTPAAQAPAEPAPSGQDPEEAVPDGDA